MLESRHVMIYRSVLLIVFFASGFAALVYQIIWQRLLTFITGTDTQSVTIIVAAVMAGLGVGSLLGGYVADRLAPRSRLRLLAACELAIASFAIISVPLYYDVLYARFGTHQLSTLTAAGLHAGAPFWPTFFMGLAFPLMTRAITMDARQPARWVPLLLGVNTLGAAIGAVTTMLVLMPAMDFSSIVQFAAIINGGCALVSYALSRDTTDQAMPPARAVESAAPADAHALTFANWMGLFALSGFMALSLEIVWFRILGVILKSDAAAFGWMLAFYLGGLGLGGVAAHSNTIRRWPATRSYLLLQAAIPLYSGLAIAALVAGLAGVPPVDRLSFYLSGGSALTSAAGASPTGLAISWLLPIGLMSVPTFFMGLSFGSLQRAAQISVATLGRRVGWLGAANVAGAIAGALATGFVLIDRLGSIGILRALMAAGGVFLWLALPQTGRRRGARPLVVATAVVAVAMSVMPERRTMWSRLHGTSAGQAIVESNSSGIAVLKTAGDSALMLVNGRGQSMLPYGGLQTDLGLVPTMLHPNPVNVAIVGLGSGNTSFSAGGRPETRRIETIEIVEPVLGALRQFDAVQPYPALTQLLRDPRMRFVFADGRAFLSKTDQRYDVIESDALRPDAAYSGNVYSLEYFSLLRTRLKRGGYAVTWLPTSRVRDTLRAAFPHVVVWGELGLGSDSPIGIDAAAIQQRLANPETQEYFRAAGIDAGAIMADYLAHPPEAFSRRDPPPRRADLNYDLFPRDEFHVQD